MYGGLNTYLWCSTGLGTAVNNSKILNEWERERSSSNEWWTESHSIFPRIFQSLSIEYIFEEAFSINIEYGTVVNRCRGSYFLRVLGVVVIRGRRLIKGGTYQTGILLNNLQKLFEAIILFEVQLQCLVKGNFPLHNIWWAKEEQNFMMRD